MEKFPRNSADLTLAKIINAAHDLKKKGWILKRVWVVGGYARSDEKIDAIDVFIETSLINKKDSERLLKIVQEKIGPPITRIPLHLVVFNPDENGAEDVYGAPDKMLIWESYEFRNERKSRRP